MYVGCCRIQGEHRSSYLVKYDVNHWIMRLSIDIYPREKIVSAVVCCVTERKDASCLYLTDVVSSLKGLHEWINKNLSFPTICGTGTWRHRGVVFVASLWSHCPVVSHLKTLSWTLVSGLAVFSPHFTFSKDLVKVYLVSFKWSDRERNNWGIRQ